MENEKKVLACVDQGRFAHPVADHAAWAALRIGAPLEFLQVLERHPERGSGDDHSGAIGIDAQEHLLDKLAADEAARTAAAREQGRLLLDGIRERVRAAGAAGVDLRQRHGRLEDVLVEQERQLRLLVMGHGGHGTASVPACLGQNVEGLVRALHVPVLIVPDTFREPRRVLLAFDGGTAARRAVEMVAASPLFQAMTIHLFMSGKESGNASSQLAWAETLLRAAGREVHVVLKPGELADNLAAILQEQSIDLLVMGAFGHSALRGLILGSKTADVLRAVRVPTLLLR